MSEGLVSSTRKLYLQYSGDVNDVRVRQAEERRLTPRLERFHTTHHGGMLVDVISAFRYVTTSLSARTKGMDRRASSICSLVPPCSNNSCKHIALGLSGHRLSAGVKSSSHKVSPLDVLLRVLHLPAELGCEHFKHPSIRVLIGQRPKRGMSENEPNYIARRPDQSKSKTIS